MATYDTAPPRTERVAGAKTTEKAPAPAVIQAAPSLHQFVVVGGGAAGLELATRLGDKLGKRGKAQVTLIDRARTHLWKPKLHEVAAGSMDVDLHSVDFLAHAHWHHYRYRIGEMIGLNRARREVEVATVLDDAGREVTPQRVFRYDTLVIAVGSQSNDFGTPGVAQYALKLETTDDAARFHRRLVDACIRAHAQVEPLRPDQLRVAIIGAGATGVELSAELHRTTREVALTPAGTVFLDRVGRITLFTPRAWTWGSASSPRLQHSCIHMKHSGQRSSTSISPASRRTTPPSADDPPRPGYHAYGTFDDDHLVARLATRGYHSWFGGSAVPSGGIAGVVVTAERRGTKLLDELFRVALDDGLRERGEAVSTMFCTARFTLRALTARPMRMSPSTSLATFTDCA